ncbi:Replicase polyprotein 1a [Dirofilaria immitis]
MMQPQSNFTVNQDESKKMKPKEYNFWCCQCSRNEINDAARISNNNKSSLSNGVVVTRQPLPSNENNYGHNNLSISNYVSEFKNDFNERKHELNVDNEMKINMKKLKEESTNITSAVLDNLISESKKVESKESTKNDQEGTKKLSSQKDSIGSVYNMEDIVISDVDEEDLWELITGNEQIINKNDLYEKWTGGDHKEQAVNGNFNDITNYDDKEEFKDTSDVSDGFSISGQISELESFEGNSNQAKESQMKLNEIEFPKNIGISSDSKQDIGKSSKLMNNITKFAGRKISTNTIDSDSLSMICIPDDDLVLKKDNSQITNVSTEIERKGTLRSECDTKAFVRSNKMYADDVSSSSSSDSDEIPDIIIPSKNAGRNIAILEAIEKTDIPARKYQNTIDENAPEDDGVTIKYKNMLKNEANVKILTDDIFSERLI